MIVRVRRTNVTPVQVWNTCVDGDPFYKHVTARRVCSVDELVHGVRRGVDVLRWHHEFTAVVLAGGLTERAGFTAAAAPMHVCSYGRFFAAAAASEIVTGDHVVMDVGQTSIKGRVGEVFERDTKILPFTSCSPDRAIDWIGRTLRKLTDGAPLGAPIVLTLPAPLDDACVLGDNTYGLARRGDAVHAILDAANVRNRDVYVLNDAELAGILAAKTAIYPTLVLTLGLGPGGAIVSP